jgi:hypothetical protein
MTVNWPPSLPPAELYSYGIEFTVKGREGTHGANDVTISAANGHVTQLKAGRSGEGDDQMQEIAFIVSDGSGGETRGTVVVRSVGKQHAVSVSMMCRNSVRKAEKGAMSLQRNKVEEAPWSINTS